MNNKNVQEPINILLSQKELQGLRGWEYGKLLHYFKGDFSGLRILDVGPGHSTFPAFLAKKAGLVTTIDYPAPLEAINPTYPRKMRKMGVSLTQGTMLQLPYQSESFDLVTCISTIEHLDVTPDTMRPIPYDRFLHLSKTALVEMMRITKPGGFIYLTTEAYEPKLQRDDNWYTEIPYQGVGAAYHLVDIDRLFAKTLREAGCHFVGPVELEPGLLLDSVSRSNFRGRYITTFCIFVQKEIIKR